MREGEQANTSRPRKQLEGKAEAAVAMAGGQELSAHAVRALGATKLELDGMGR